MRELRLVLGRSASGIATEVALNGHRPHVRWIGPRGVGKTPELMRAAGQCVVQIPPCPDQLRMVLFETPTRPHSCSDLLGLPGVMTINPTTVLNADNPNVALDLFNRQLQRRRDRGAGEPLVLVVNDYTWWLQYFPTLHTLATEPEPGVHLLLAATDLTDFDVTTAPPCSRQPMSWMPEHAAKSREEPSAVSERFRTVVLPAAPRRQPAILPRRARAWAPC
ncbi:hypothetical protein [Mycolicibacterium fortuitum]